MKLAYPAVFTPFDDKKGYIVDFPDLPGCITEGNTVADAIFMAEDAASGWVLTDLEDGKSAPKASDPGSIEAPDGGFVSMVALDMDAYAEKYGKKAIKKTLTIPARMNTQSNGISCSKVLQEALVKHIILVICIIVIAMAVLPYIIFPWPIALLITLIELLIFWVRDAKRKGTIYWDKVLKKK